MGHVLVQEPNGREIAFIEPSALNPCGSRTWVPPCYHCHRRTKVMLRPFSPEYSTMGCSGRIHGFYNCCPLQPGCKWHCCVATAGKQQ